MQIGISQLICGNMSMREFFAAAKEAGYETVEVSMKASGPLTGDVTPEEVAEIKALSAEFGLPVSSMTINHCTGNLLDSGEAQARSIEETAFGLEVAAELGATAALTTLGRFTSELYYDDAYRNAVDSLRKLAPTAEKLGVALAYEFVWNGFCFSPLEVKNLLDEVGSEYIGFYFDPGNMAVFQFPHHWVRIVGKHIKRVHLKDWKGRALNGEWTPLLKGEVNFPAVMRELHAIGYNGPLVSEVSPSLASLAETAETARKLLDM
jgi:hexulose-6-phosphate isomerase